METVNDFLKRLARGGVKLSVEGGRLNCYAPDGILTPDLRGGIGRHRSEIITLLKGRERRLPSESSDRGVGYVREFPLSAGQKGLYIFQQLHRETSVYNVPLGFRIRGDIDVEMLTKAWECVLEQFPILRARVIERDGALYHRVDDDCRTTIQHCPLTCTGDQELLSLLRARAKQPFDLNRGPLTRIELFGPGQEESVLLLTIHHLVIDGTSAMIVLMRLFEFYRQLCEGRPVRLAHDLPGYEEFVLWEEAMLASAEGGAHASYWRKQLDGELPVFGLPLELDDAPSTGLEGKTLVEQLPENLSQWIREFCRTHSLPPSVFFLALFQLVLHQYSGQDEIIIGMPVMGRVQQKFALDVGYFINMVPLRTRWEAGLKLSEMFRRVQATMLDGLFHSSYPFPLMLEKLQIQEVRKHPVFQVTYAYQNFVSQDSFAPFLQRQKVDIVNIPEVTQEGESDLGLEIFEGDPVFTLRVKYNPDLYADHAIRRLCDGYRALLKGVSESGDLPLHEYSMISDLERLRLLIEFNDTDAGYPSGQCLHQLFMDQVESHFGNTAVVCGDEYLTYQQLQARSHDLALYLQCQGVGPDSLVGLCMDRSPDMVVGLLGILRAGGAYVPLDPNYPDERLSYTLEDSAAAIVLTQESLLEKLRGLVKPETRLVAVDLQRAEIGERVAGLKAKGVQLRQDVKPHHLAYVIYTSGSTGKPKGVAIEHHSPVTLVRWARDVYSREELTGVLASTSICFDLSVFEIFVTLACGGTIILVPNALELLSLANRESVTLINTVPSAIEELVRLDAIPGSVRTINLAGEPLSARLVDKIYDSGTVERVYDLYGPSEDTTYSTYALRKRNGPQTIGRPIANTRVYILDGQNHIQPIGVPGELHIAGDGLAREYLNRPELTQTTFVANPFEPGTRMYKTGDWARWLEDGSIQYLGRIDTQVKIRGFRIEIGEIEVRLRDMDGIQDCAVVTQGQGASKQLVGFYVAKETNSDHVVELPGKELRARLSQTLPEYMLPAAFVSLAAIPLSANGKVDRRALERMDPTMASSHAYVAPHNDTEQGLVAIWAEVLNIAPEKIGVEDNFFELGGHTLLATRLISKIRSHLDVDLPLNAIFERTSVAKLAESVAAARKNEIPAIRPVDRTRFDRLPLSFAQERLWFINQLEPESAGYNVPGAVVVRGELDIDQLDRAFNLIVERHENLRTIFPDHEGQVRQRILDRLDFKLERIDLSHYDDSDGRDEKAEELCQADAATPFDLAGGPLIRGKVITLAEHEHLLMLNMHHIISDGWSLGILIEELGLIMEAFREGRPPELAPLPIQYADYSVWQREWLEESGLLKEQLRYWQEKLAGAPESLDLATDYPRPSVQNSAGATRAFTLDTHLTRQLKRLADEKGATVYMVLLAAFNVLLHRYTGQNDICVGSPIANRQYGETEGLIGMFANTLALRSQVVGEERFLSLLSKVRATCLEAYAHQDAPFEKVVDAVHPKRNLAITPLFQTMLVLHNVDMRAADEQIQRYPLDSGISKFDLTFAFTETPDGLDGSIEYCTALFAPQTIARMVEHFKTLCRAITGKPATKICDLDYIAEAEKNQVLADFNAARADYPTDRCLHELFVEQVADHSEKTAVAWGDEHLTYQQLHARSHDLALYLQSQGVGPDSLVGLCMERSPDMVVGLLGILQAGGAYVPLDPNYPDERLAHMLKDSGASIVLTQEKLREKLRGLGRSGTGLMAVDGQTVEIGERVAELKANGVPLRHDVKPDHLAYVIYTSGSTGKPKGVAIEHHSPVTLVRWARDVYSQAELAGVLASTSICFDLSVFEIFVTLASGGTIILVSNALELLSLSNRESVTLINTVPSAMEELARFGAIPDSVRTINLAGELLSPTLVDKIYDNGTVEKVYDLYGPSEDTTYSTYALRKKTTRQTIGRPIANTQVYILDRQNRPQPIGVPGELYIAGDGLARGYLNRPELTREKFVANPFTPGTRMYKTGDLARWLDDGNIQYLGRIDTQVKIRGFRIELGEIEAGLNQYPAIQDSVVIAQGEGAGRQLVAYYRAKGTAPDDIVELTSEELRAHLSRTLPDYMVPAAFVSLAAIPLSPSGKADRRALARMDVTFASSNAYEAPRNDTENDLVAIWAGVLNREPKSIGVNDNFFELGGHSLLATRLISKIRSQMGVDLPLKTAFDRTTVARLAVFIAEAERSEIPPIQPVDRAQFERLPLSFAEERVWYLTLAAPDGTPFYNVPGAFVIHGELDLDQMDEALNVIIGRHESLRTVFPVLDGQAQRVILDRLDFRFQRTDLSQYDEGVRESRAREICLADARTPFDLSSGPLIRGNVITLEDHEHIVMVNMQHIISDGWSIGVFVKEFHAIMDALRHGRRPELAPLPIQYVDYSIWQRQWLEEGGLLARQLAYWKEKLAGMPESLDLATDYPRPSVRSGAGATCSFSIDAQLTADLKRLAERQGATLYMVLLATFKALLHRYTGQNDICLGTPIANRNYGETEGLIGMFVNTMALRSKVEGDETFVALLSKVKATCLEAYENQDAPFPKVVDMLEVHRNTAISPLFQVVFILQSAYMGVLDQKTQRYFLDTGVAKYDLTMEFLEPPEGLDGVIEYSTTLFKPETIARMVEHFKTLCRAVTGKPTAKICDLDYMGEAEKNQVLAGFNAARADYPKDRCLHELFVEQVADHSGKTAVVCGDEHLTYQQLHARSRDLALYLQSQRVEPDSLVGLCMDRSPDMIVGLLGILQAGGAYVALDPNYPDERLAHMLEDSGATIVLTQEKLREKLRGLGRPGTRLVAVDRQTAEIGGRVAELKANGVPLRHDVKPHHLAYVIYTSGSTGKPKGVAIEHHSPVTLVHWAREVYSQEELAGVLASTSICFDLSVFEIFVTLASGGTIILVPNALELLGLSNRESVTLINTVPSAMEELARFGAIPDSVRTINLAGELLSPALVDRIYDNSMVEKVYDLYGPSEDTTYSTYTLRKRNAPQTIGRPLANTQVYILDRQNHPQPIGVPGELHVAGDGLARGYLNRPELTKEKFVPNPFTPGTRMYKTGDLARWLDDGNIQYLGRIDTQVKIRGFRIELGEVEARLNQHSALQDSAVVAQGEGAEKQLIAFYRAKETTAVQIVQLTNEELRAHLLRALPEYMVPAAFVSIPAIPLSSSGKVDRRVLERTSVTKESSQEYVEPRSDTERRLVAIWAEILKLAPEKVGVHDNFFEAGGNSLSSVQFISRINRGFNRSLPLSVIFTGSTVAALAKLLSSEETTSSFDILVPIKAGGDTPPIFGIPGAGGVVLSLQPLSRALGTGQSFYGLQAVGLDGKTLPLKSVEETARANIAALKTLQPRGPYSFIGHSYGGIVAYEMTRILLEQAEQIASLTLLDSIAPSAGQKEAPKDEATELWEAYTAIATLGGTDLGPDWNRLRRSTHQENVRYLVDLLNDGGDDITEEHFAAFLDVFRANLACYRAYKPPMLPLEIDVSLYRATQGHTEEPTLPGDYGWNRLLRSPIRIHDVKADHFSILERVQFRAGAFDPRAEPAGLH
jgi:amino acid adenylation domain-containing protein